MPGARCTRGLACKIVQQTHTSIQVQRRHSDIPCAMVYGLYVLPGVPGLLATVASRTHHPQNLTPASGGQDHTISLVRIRATSLATPTRHRIPLPTFVTMAKRPSDGD